jgi:hypothetical protein
MISQLLILRKNSKFFAKFLIGWLKNTKDFNNVELLILANQGDTWNQDLFEYYKLKVFYEDSGFGKDGRAEFYNQLAKEAKGDWIWPMCDDHYLIKNGYDEYLTEYLKDKDFSKPKIVLPKVDNSGAIAHILSRGWLNTTGRIAKHGNIDTYLNDCLEMLGREDIIFRPEEPILTDFTVDPTIMTPEHSQVRIDPIDWPYMKGKEIFDFMVEDTSKIGEALCK